MVAEAAENTSERNESHGEVSNKNNGDEAGVVKRREISSKKPSSAQKTAVRSRGKISESTRGQLDGYSSKSPPKLKIAFTIDEICSDEDNRLLIQAEEKEKSEDTRGLTDSSTTVTQVHEFSYRPSIIECFPLNATCMLCCATLHSPYELQAHLALQRHLPREEILHNVSFQYPLFDCVECRAQKISKDHNCMKNLSDSLKAFVEYNTREGTPLTCILCEGKQLQSVHHLIVHIVTYHGFRNRPPNDKYIRCPFCHALFKTRNTYTIEAHALDVHLPELVIKKQKLMHADGQPNNFSIRHFSCYFENSKYAPLSQECVLQNCSATYPELCSLIGHLCYAHYPVPADFLPTKARPISCKACLLRFKNRTTLRDHVLSFHSQFMRFRATSLSYDISFYDHCNPTLVCHLCWASCSSIPTLQVHILVYHVDSWRFCGFCKRELCRANDVMNPTILYLTMERHVEHHVKQLEDHFEEMVDICELRKKPHQNIVPIPPSHEENFFRRVQIQTHKLTEDDKVELIMAQFCQFARSESFDLDDIL